MSTWRHRDQGAVSRLGHCCRFQASVRIMATVVSLPSRANTEHISTEAQADPMFLNRSRSTFPDRRSARGWLLDLAFLLLATMENRHRGRRCFRRSLAGTLSAAAARVSAVEAHCEFVGCAHRFCRRVRRCGEVAQAFCQTCRSARSWCLWGHHIHCSGAREKQAKKRC